MSFQWEDYQSLSEDLLTGEVEPGLEEATYRTAISRAFYGVYHEADAWRQSKNRPLANYGGSQEKVIFTFCENAEEQAVKAHLTALKVLRKRADYKADAVIDYGRAEAACLQAEAARAKIGQLGQ